MTYYHQEIIRIREEHYLKPYISDHLSRAKRFIDENCCTAIDLQAISEFSFLSKFHLIRLFTRQYGITPHQYLTERRIQAAKRLLASQKTVMETCYHIGFESPNSFSAAFRKYTGVSPSEYRKKQFSIRFPQKTVPILSGTKK
jgi:AraC-like DNA-binding protein